MEASGISILKITALTGAACLVAFLGYKYVTADPPGYCRAQQRYIPDEEFIKLAVKLREDEIARHGGLDAYEKELIRQKNNPDDAGRDFDIKDPNCCWVYRGESKVDANCGGHYTTCVKLNYRTKKWPSPYSDVGRTYFFDDCGNIKDPL